MRADPYQARARALAVEAGLDPDAKIDRSGQRPMPTWCTFRDAARKEQVVTETAAVAAALPPHAPQFQNSPLKVFGDRDEGILAQMRNCMCVGNVVAGVICADGGPWTRFERVGAGEGGRAGQTRQCGRMARGGQDRPV